MIQAIKYLILIIFLSSCKDYNPLLPKVNGLPGEVLVVIPDTLWNDSPGQELKNVLSTTFEGLPQEEPMFDVIQINERNFGRLFKQHRNIIFVSIGNKYPEKKILTQKNRWADTQIILNILAPTDTAFINLLGKNKIELLSVLSDAERSRFIRLNNSLSDKRINDRLYKKHNLKLAIPNSYTLDVDSAGFSWLSCEYGDIIQGIFIYEYKFTNLNTFTKNYLLTKRDEVLKKYVPGEVKGSYMITERHYPTLFNQYEMGDSIATFELRGLWKVQNGLAMGGPFISITMPDVKRNRVITVEGFVFAPAHKKRELLRQVEAIVWSAKIL